MKLYDIDYYVNGTSKKYQAIVTNLFYFRLVNNVTITYKKVYTNEDINNIVNYSYDNTYSTETFEHMKYRVYDYFIENHKNYSLLLITSVLSHYYNNDEYDRRQLIYY